MKPLAALAAASLVVLPCLCAQGQIVQITKPVDLYTKTTTVYTSGLKRPDGWGTMINSITAPGGQTVTFNYPTMINWISNGWGTPPAVESAIPASSFQHNFDYCQFPYPGCDTIPAHDALVMTLSEPAKVFGFEVLTLGRAFDGDHPATAVTAKFKNGNNVLGTITKSMLSVSGNAQFIAAQSETPITSVEVTCSPSSNIFIAQIRSGQGLVDSVEITQAIQQYQTLDDLKKSLQQNQDPPVPIVTGKPAALRVYLKPLPVSTKLQVRLSNVVNQTKAQTVPRNCIAENERRQNKCPSFDFYFTPPSGNWTAHLDILDANGTILESHDLPTRSWDTDSVLVRAASVCDSNSGGHWQCQKASSLSGGMLDFFKKIVPASKVNLQVTNQVSRHDFNVYPNAGSWWSAIVRDLNGMYGPNDIAADTGAKQYTVYFGMVRPGILGGIGGIAAAIPSHGAASRSSTVRMGQEVKYETLAHELGHTLGVRHTNIPVAAPAPAPPGCYNFAVDPVTDWTYGDNRIQSTARPEVGFDVARKKALDPNSTFDLGSYCSPRWASPLHYKAMVSTLTQHGQIYAPSPSFIQPGPTALTSEAPRPKTGRTAQAEPPVLTTGLFWEVRGTLQNGAATLLPVFAVQMQGSTDSGFGTYGIEVQDASGTRLFVRYFTPQTTANETTGPDGSGPPYFSEWIPVYPNAAAIVIKDSIGSPWQRLPLGGAPPNVTITTPAAGFVGTGDKMVSWTIQGSGASTYTSRVQYSPDNGSTWVDLGEVTDTSTDVNFDDLPGTGAALIRVLVSDGANTGTAISQPFSVPRKSPQTPEISEPPSGAYLAAADPVQLSGSALDPDDGNLTGAALQWSSDRQRALGTGTDLSVNLQPGQHVITLTAKDSDGNTVTASVTVTVVDEPPTVSLTGGAGSQAVLNAAPGNNGAPLTAVEYSSDGGATWIAAQLSSLPLTLTFAQPTTLMVQATDAAGQSTTSETSVSQPPLAVAVSPATVSVVEWDTQQFTATVSGTSNNEVVWTVALGPDAPPDAKTGLMGSDGSYDAPPHVSSSYTVIVSATSQFDYRTSASATVLVQPELITTPPPPSGPSSVTAGTLYQFTASATSSLNHPLQYIFFWAPGSFSDWTSPGVSSSFHSWSAPGTYYISAQARCSIHPWEISSYDVEERVVTVLPAAGGPFSIGNYTLVNSQQLTRTVSQYTYRATLTNGGPAITGATATVVSSSPSTVIVSNSLTFGAAAASGQVVSSDTFVFNFDRTYTFDANALQWTVNATLAAPNP